jgi:hypothetical protein
MRVIQQANTATQRIKKGMPDTQKSENMIRQAQPGQWPQLHAPFLHSSSSNACRQTQTPSSNQPPLARESEKTSDQTGQIGGIKQGQAVRAKDRRNVFGNK